MPDENKLFELEALKLPESFRAFFALSIADEVQEKIGIIIEKLKKETYWRNLRWSEAKNLHITLRFLGNINQQQYIKISEQVARALAENESAQATVLDFSNLQPFPSRVSPRALILQAKPMTQLQKLFILLDKIVVSYGVKPELRPFVPHLTLGRFKNKIILFDAMNQNLQKFTQELTELKLDVNKIILYRSVPNRAGSLYIPMRSFDLKPSSLNDKINKDSKE